MLSIQKDVNEQEADARIRGYPEEDRWTITATIGCPDSGIVCRSREPQSSPVIVNRKGTDHILSCFCGPRRTRPQSTALCQTMMIGRSGSGHRPARKRPDSGRIPGGRFSQTGSLERAVRGGALRDELPPVTCHPIHTPWLCECGPPIKLARKETDRTSPFLAGLLSSPAEGHVRRGRLSVSD